VRRFLKLSRCQRQKNLKWGAHRPGRSQRRPAAGTVRRRLILIRVRNLARVRRGTHRTATGTVALPKSRLERLVKFKPQTPPREIIRLTAE